MPAERTVDRLRRIVVLVPWVIADPGCTVDEVCERFGISVEQLSADLSMLMVCGLPPFGPGDLIEASIEGGRVWIRMADYLERPPRLTASEAVALLVMGRAAAQLPGVESASLTSALGKLAGALPPHEEEAARQIAARIEVELAGDGTDVLAQVRSARADRARLRIVYYTQGRGELNEREIDPWLAFAANGAWYVVAFDHASGEERTFRLDRIKELERTGDLFELPDDLDPDRYALGPVIVPSERDHRVVIEADARAAWLAEFIPAGEVTPRRDRLRIRTRTAHLGWLVQLLLLTGAAARALEPPALVEAVQTAARAALARYA